jgi:hypothetical protein
MLYSICQPKNGERVMNLSFKLVAATVLASAASFAAPASAAPITAPSSLQNATASSVEAVPWRRGWRGRGGGWGPGPFVAGAIIGGAIAASRPWNYGYYDGYGYGPGYGYAPGYAPGYSYAPGPGYATGYNGGDADAYCSQRFRSYDPASGTYMGYDGQRHPCP